MLRRAVVILFVLSALTAGIALAEPRLTYIIDVAGHGNATVAMLFIDEEPGESYIIVPRFEKYNLTYSGDFKIVNISKYTYFYNMLNFSYAPSESGVFELRIEYRFPYASLIVGDRAWFMTPMIGAPNSVKVYVNVTLANLKSIEATSGLEKELHPLSIEGNKLTFRVFNTARGARVIVEYSLEYPVPIEDVTRVIDNTTVVVRVPATYRELERRVLETYRRTKPLLEEIFGGGFKELEFRFFLPRLRDIATLGFVRGEEITLRGEGPIFLNMLLLRYVPGYFEVTVVHEYIHKALGRAGIEANNELRWFHEGVAEYVSLRVCKLAGINVSELEKGREEFFANFEKTIKELTGGDLGSILQDWESPAPMDIKYAASEYIVTELAERYGGLDFIRKVVAEAEKYGRVSTTEDLIAVLNRAAREDLRPQFRNWGFIVSERDGGFATRVRSAKLHKMLALIAILLAIAVLLSLVFALRYLKARKEASGSQERKEPSLLWGWGA